jgi:hypothetical protein
MRSIYRLLLLIPLIVAFVSAPMTNMVQTALALGTDCATSSPVSAAYSATICITSPADGASFTGDGTITGTVSVTGTNPGAQSLVFYLNGAYLLTTYSSPYTFTLPTNRWVDGSYTLSAEALMRDGFTTTQASISVIFNTGTSTPPVNSNHFTPSTGRPASGQPFVVAAVGDGAGGETTAANVTNLIAAINPNLFLYIGDVYEKGSVAEFYNWYAPSTFFGRFRSITDPTIGNHDYLSGSPAAYLYYWDNIPDYYSFNANGWHIISLNSNSAFIGVGPTSAEYLWLQQDLATNSSPCTLVTYHHPYFSIGPEGTKPAMVDIWKLMVQYKVDIVLNGHDHDYERWVALDGNGVPSPTGITEFVLGVGGHSLQTIVNSDNRVANWNDSNPAAYGALFLQLNPTNAVFTYRSTNGSVLDSGTIPCVDPSILPLQRLYLPFLHR